MAMTPAHMLCRKAKMNVDQTRAGDAWVVAGPVDKSIGLEALVEVVMVAMNSGAVARLTT